MSGGGLWGQPYHPARGYVLQRGLYLIVALDAWLLMLEHGGRYGVGGFNVAHFAWLDRLLPLPSAPLYVALIASCGLISAALALFSAPLPVQLTLFVAYTVAWSVSMHDSYQHHYFLSWLLLYVAFLPRCSAAEAAEVDRRVTGAALPLTALTCANLYVFTAISKLSPEWRHGLVLRALAAGRNSSPFVWPVRALGKLGVSEVSSWRALAAALVTLQVVVALGYVASVFRDQHRTRLVSVLCAAALLAALVFHGAAEVDGALGIGWFSYYMVFCALTLLAPAPLLARLCGVLSTWQKRPREIYREHPPSLLLVLGVAALALLIVAQRADLPGVSSACAGVFCLFALEACRQWLADELDEALRALLCVTVSAAAFLCVLELTSVRFDYYRRAAGERVRMGRSHEALVLYRKAEQYAPPGRTRMNKIDALQRSLGAADDERPEVGGH